MRKIGEWQALDAERRPGSTIVKLALNVGNIMTTKVRERKTYRMAQGA